MQVQFNTDESVEGHEELGRHAESVVRKALDRFGDQITRIEIHVSDVNGQKSGDNDKRCLIEARIAGRQPIAVTEQANSIHQAIDGATHKIRRSLDSTLGKLADKKRSALPPGAVADETTPDET